MFLAQPLAAKALISRGDEEVGGTRILLDIALIQTFNTGLLRVASPLIPKAPD
jgi:hypothetical protein